MLPESNIIESVITANQNREINHIVTCRIFGLFAHQNRQKDNLYVSSPADLTTTGSTRNHRRTSSLFFIASNLHQCRTAQAPAGSCWNVLHNH